MVLLADDSALVVESDYILSIVPPRDAQATARRIQHASQSKDALAARKSRIFKTSASPTLTFIDLNAVSPKSARIVAELFPDSHHDDHIPIRFLDGGIIGGPPSEADHGSWKKPSVVVSGPYNLSAAHSPDPGPHLAEVLNMKHVGDTIGPASGLKMCFASTTKGLTAIAIQSYTTAETLGVLPQLRDHLKHYNSKTFETAEWSLPAMCPKAYRWVEEMRQIGETFQEDGGFQGNMFEGAAEVYRCVADDTSLGLEKTEDRKRGKTADDVAALMVEGIKKRKEKTE